MQAIARASFVRFPPTKVNRVLQLVRKKSVMDALKILKFAPQKTSVLVAKTIKSAAANAGDLQAKNPRLIVDSAWVGQGPSLKRMRAYAMGRGFMYKRKTCHLTVIVTEGKKKTSVVQGA